MLGEVDSSVFLKLLNSKHWINWYKLYTFVTTRQGSNPEPPCHRNRLYGYTVTER